MKTKFFYVLAGLLAICIFSFKILDREISDDRFVIHIVDPAKESIQFFLDDENENKISNFSNLKDVLKSEGNELIFAANGGMYMEDQRPLGLYIEKGKVVRKLNKREEGYGNFYMHPNGVFAIQKDGKAKVSARDEIILENLQFATQSGPMLVHNGKIHSQFNEGSKNLHVRNAVGILPDGKVLFAMSKKRINFYDFAQFYKEQGCENALYLDGFVSKTYLPSSDWVDSGGRFGVIIAHVKEKK